jgi:hypothetical protein
VRERERERERERVRKRLDRERKRERVGYQYIRLYYSAATSNPVPPIAVGRCKAHTQSQKAHTWCLKERRRRTGWWMFTRRCLKPKNKSKLVTCTRL